MEEKFRSNSVQNSPSVEGVDFFAIAKKDQGSVGKQISNIHLLVEEVATEGRRGVVLENIPLLIEGVPAIAGGVVLAIHGRIF